MDESEKKVINNASTVLVAEDDEFLSRVLVDKFEREHFNVAIARDGDEAVQKVIAGGIDAMVLDIIMPKKTGFDVIDEIKANEQTKNIPIIVLSNLGQEGDVERAKEKGVTNYFIKSNISMGDVVKKIQELLKNNVS